MVNSSSFPNIPDRYTYVFCFYSFKCGFDFLDYFAFFAFRTKSNENKVILP